MERLTPRGFHFHEGEEKWLPRGVTYGPFRPNGDGASFPEPDQQRRDFEAIAAMGANALRVYNVPDEALAHRAAECDLRLLIDIAWPKHLDVYRDADLRRLCLGMVEEGITQIKSWPNVLGLILGNEVPPDIVRWAGVSRVRSFLRVLYDRAKGIFPDVPVGYANYPSTEYLPLGLFDFLGFNIYLEDPEAFRSYLVRLRHLYPDLPLVLTEVGLDSQRNGAERQAEFLGQSLSIAFENGLAGAFVFSWTDEWHAGGFDMVDWSFGLVDRERRPKPSHHAVSEVFQRAPQCETREEWPKVSVVVATHNGARTLRFCLESLKRLDYPNHEIIVVDDGSTDETQEILREFQDLNVVTQENRGLSAARNAGIAVAEGSIVAFTDSDCVVDPDWLHHLVVIFEQGQWAGVGGPNLTPHERGLAPRSVALAPGHATHVLIDHVEAEHVPGCNMAFRRHALLEVSGFDPQFTKAGDDVDIMWRLQDAGHKIGFSAAGFVWHHRRSTVRAYWRQQMGYGEAEAMLLHKHPHRFNERGHSIWRGTIYAQHENTALLRKPVVHFGVFGSAGYQCIYERPGGALPHLITSLEWWLFCALALALGFVSPAALRLGMAGIALSLTVSGIRTHRKWSAAKSRSLPQFALAWLLWVTQPLVRGGARQWSRLPLGSHTSRFMSGSPPDSQDIAVSSPSGTTLTHWGESGLSRLDVLRHLAEELASRGWIFRNNTEWEPWDLSVSVSRWFRARLTSAEEDHGQGRQLLRQRFRLVPTGLVWLCITAVLILTAAVATQDTELARYLLVGGFGVGWVLYRRGCRGRATLMSLVDTILQTAGHQPIPAGRDRSKRRPADGQTPQAADGLGQDQVEIPR